MTTATDLLNLLQEAYLLKGIAAAVLAGALCGFVGPYMAWKNLGLFGASLSHAALFPIAIALSFAIPFEFLLYPFVVLLALLIAFYRKENFSGLDSYLAIFYSGFMALGVLAFAYNGQGSSEVIHYLFGEILIITNFDLIILSLLLILVLTFACYFKKPLIMNVIQSEIAAVEMKNSKFVHYTSYLIMALVIAACIKIMGIVLLTSLLIVPTIMVSKYTTSLQQHFFLSVVMAILLAFTGILLSLLFNLPSGASIAALAMCSFFISSLIPKKS